jgi:uncharacterized protein YndB with AHSA1/START domain
MPVMTGPPALTLHRHCHAPRERVFAAWSDPHKLEAWYTPGADWTIAVDFVDFRVGGRYRVRFGPPDESVAYVEEGTYHEIDAPMRIAFDTTLRADGRVLSETRCHVELREAHDGTDVAVTETGFADEHREARADGWGRTLDNLVRYVVHDR